MTCSSVCCSNVTSDVRQTCAIAYSSDVDVRFHFCNTIPLFLFDCVSFLTAILPGLCVFSDRNPAMEYTEKLPVEIDPEMWFTRGWNWQKCMDRWKGRGGKSQRGEEKKRRRDKIREEKE